MWRRGADSDGYVANFVETEQIVQINGFCAAFVQVKPHLHFYIAKEGNKVARICFHALEN